MLVLAAKIAPVKGIGCMAVLGRLTGINLPNAIFEALKRPWVLVNAVCVLRESQYRRANPKTIRLENV